MRINIETKDINQLRFKTLGDYFYDTEGVLNIQVAETYNTLFSKTIIIHELIEEMLTNYVGIKEEEIMKFDLWVEEEVKKGDYSPDAEPGEHPLSPYKKQHDFAMIIERQIMNFLNIDFNEYETKLDLIFDKWKNTD